MTRPFIIELRVSPSVEAKLARREIELEDVIDVLFGRPRFFRDRHAGRTKMIGPINGTMYTFVIEPTDEDGVWDTVTGWRASKGERTKWSQAK